MRTGVRILAGAVSQFALVICVVDDGPLARIGDVLD